MRLTVESSNSYSRLLPWKLRGLGVIIDDAIATKDLVELLRIICHDFVIFIKNSPVLRPLRITWENDAKKQELLIKKAEKKLIISISKAYDKLAYRIHDENLSEDPFIKHFLCSIQDALFFRQAYGNPPFYVIALGMLNGLCRELLNRDRSDILDKIAEVEYSPQPHRKPIKATFCNKEVYEFLELQRAFALENSNTLWLPWLLLRSMHECWFMPAKKMSQIELKYSSEKESLKSTGHWAFYNYWNALKAIREKSGQSQLFTEELMIGLIKAICRQLFVYTSTPDAEVDNLEKIHSIALKLDGDLLNLIVKWNDSSKPSIYILKQLRFEGAPFKFIQALLKRPGKTILLNGITDSQSVANLLDRTHLKGILANIFIQNSNTTATLYAEEILFLELPERQKLEFQEFLPTLKLYE